MDALQGLPRTLPAVFAISQQTFAPLLEANKATITAITRKTFKYGNHAKQELDVYYPAHATGASADPILIYFYGGGFAMGAKQSPNPLICANFGSYFARKGILTVIADYRLLGDGAIYPSGVQDVYESVSWVTQNLSDVGDVSRIFLLGNSAGGIHTANFLTSKGFASFKGNVTGVIFTGVAFSLEKSLPFYENAAKYFGGEEILEQNKPSSQLAALSTQEVKSLPPIKAVYSENDPEVIEEASKQYVKDWQAKGGVASVSVAKRHNHISITLAPGSGVGEEWANEVAAWIKQQ